MSDVNKSYKQTGRRVKAALIPMLTLILIAVLYRLRDESVPAPPGVTLANPAEIARAANRSAPDKTGGAVRWPEVDLNRVTEYSPFDPPAVPGEGAAQIGDAVIADEPVPETSAQAHDIAIPKVDAIYEVAGQRVAVVEGRVVRVGDVLAQGRVAEITRTELVVEFESPANVSLQ